MDLAQGDRIKNINIVASTNEITDSGIISISGASIVNEKGEFTNNY
mgnify:CR=1 FL=1